jgi:hypothetical protein
MQKKMITTRRYGVTFSKRYSPRDRRAIGIAIIVLGLFILVLAAREYRLNQKFAGPTIKVIGSIDALYPSKGRYNPQVAYRYPIDAIEFHTIASVDQEVFAELHVGESLLVKYLPDNPTINRIDVRRKMRIGKKRRTG